MESPSATGPTPRFTRCCARLIWRWVSDSRFRVEKPSASEQVKIETSKRTVTDAFILGQKTLMFEFLPDCRLIPMTEDHTGQASCWRLQASLQNYAAPEPFRRAGIVLARILRSSQSDHLSIYCMSSSIHLSKAMELLPFTCQRQVIPGRTLNRRRWQSSLNPS